MPDKNSVLVLGLDTLASAAARFLLLSGHAVVLLADDPRAVLRRRMTFADAWHDGVAQLEGVEARRVRQSADLLAGMRSAMYIPLLAAPWVEACERWPWDVIVDARSLPPGARRDACGDAGLTIALGPGAVAGSDCDLVIETGGPDPGAVARHGPATGGAVPHHRLENPALAPRPGTFRACRSMGDQVTAGEVIAIVDTVPVPAPASGRLRGLMRSPCPVAAGEVVAEIAIGATAQVSGIHPADQALARAVDLAIALEPHDLPASPFLGR